MPGREAQTVRAAHLHHQAALGDVALRLTQEETGDGLRHKEVGLTVPYG